MVESLTPVPRFGARLITPDPVAVRFVQGDVNGYVPARVWELEKKDIRPALRILKTWGEAGQPLSAQALGRLLKKSPIDTLAAQPASKFWLAYGLSYLGSYTAPILFYPLGIAASILMYAQMRLAMSNSRIYAMTVGDWPSKKQWGGGKTIGFLHMTSALNVNYISQLETAYWNQRPSGQKNFRFFGALEGMVYAAIREQGTHALEWLPAESSRINRFYKNLLRRHMGIKPINLLAFNRFSEKGVQKMMDVLEERYRNTPIDPKISRIAAEAVKSIPEPQPLVPLPPRLRRKATRKKARLQAGSSVDKPKQASLLQRLGIFGSRKNA